MNSQSKLECKESFCLQVTDDRLIQNSIDIEFIFIDSSPQ